MGMIEEGETQAERKLLWWIQREKAGPEAKCLRWDGEEETMQNILRDRIY